MLSTRYPIEHIVLTFILTTLAYFHTLRQIKHSTWFSSTASLNPIQLTWFDGAFVSQEAPLTASTGVQSVVLVGGQPTFTEDSVKNYSEFLTSLIPQSSMHRASPDSFTLTFPTSSSLPAPSEWAVAEYGPDSNNLTLAISSSDKPMSVLDMSKIESSAWIAYAFRAFVLRLWDLTMKADSLDISVVVLGYVLMHITFLSLPYRSRLLFHSTSPQHTHAPYIWLSLAIFASSLTSFIVSLPVSSFSPFNITLEPIALSEALPFFVITVGFDKPLRLARSVFSHQSLYSSSYPARKVVDDAWKTVGSGIFRDYVIEVAILLAASAVSGSGSGGVREFCRLASLTLILDGISLVGFYSSILTVMVEVQRIKSSPATPTKSLSQAETKVEETHESPVPRLKLLLLISFLTLHLLNFLDVLSPTVSAGLGLGYKFRMHEKVVDFSKKSSTQMDEGWAISLIESLDVKPSEGDSWVVYPPLYVQALTAIELDNGNNHTISGNPSLYSPSPLPLRSASPTTDIPHKATKHATSSLLSTLRKIKSPFSLSGTLGDPLLSKWIALALAISFSLNGVLLKGLSRGSSSHISEEDEAEPEKEKKSEKSANPTFKITDTDLTPTVENMTIPLSLSSGAGAGSMTQTELEVEQPLKKRRDMEREKLIIDLTDAKFPVLNEEDVTTPPATGPTTETPRPLAELKELYTSATANQFSIQELAMLVKHGMLAAHSLEKVLPDDLEKAVLVRRELLSSETATFEGVPFENFAYEKVLGACCENVVGYMPLPLGIAGPLNIDGKVVHLPMATAEGTLVASTSRGCKALNASIGGGVTTVLTQDIMTRGPALAFPSITSCAKAKAWLDSTQGAQIMANAFNSTSRFARLQKLKCVMAGRTLYVRFATSTGDAMGMNMISKGCEKALEVMATQYFPEMQILSLSGNYCTDKKPAAINWIEGRGKSVVAEAVVPGDVVKKVLKTTVEDLVQLNLKKNLVGSAMAGAIGGFNAHAANIVAAMFLATGQDPAQVVESANCITLMEAVNDCKDLLITVTLPSIEVGTVGGGTVLPPQHAVLKYLGIAGAHPTSPGHNARQLARIIGAAVMAAELSLMSALAAGHLVRAHVSLNRTPVSTRPSTPAPQMIGGVGGNSGGFGGGLSPFGFGMTPMTPHTNGTSNGTPNKERVSPTTSSSLTRITEMENGKGGYM